MRSAVICTRRCLLQTGEGEGRMCHCSLNASRAALALPPLPAEDDPPLVTPAQAGRWTLYLIALFCAAALVTAAACSPLLST